MAESFKTTRRDEAMLLRRRLSCNSFKCDSSCSGSLQCTISIRAF
jgi:hypothetical protein